MALGGEPVGPRYIDWNFVSSSKERIEPARADWAAGRLKLPDLDNDEFIPLPPKVGRMVDPEPMSCSDGATFGERAFLAAPSWRTKYHRDGPPRPETPPHRCSGPTATHPVA